MRGVLAATALATLATMAGNGVIANAATGAATGAETGANPHCEGEVVGWLASNTTEAALITLTDEHRRYVDRGCWPAVLEAALDEGLPLVVFVHGRGTHPRKTVREMLLENLREQDVAPVMLAWPSWEGPTAFPEAAARAAGSDLAHLLDLLATAMRPRPEQRATLLVHSMGALVLEGLARGPEVGAHPDLFENLVVSGAAAGIDGHAEWLEAARFARRVVVLVNRDDVALRCIEGDAGALRDALFCAGFDEAVKATRRLGRWAAEPDAERAANAVYVDLTGPLGSTHRYYAGRGARKHPGLERVAGELLRGGSPSFDRPDFETVEPGRLYRLAPAP